MRLRAIPGRGLESTGDAVARHPGRFRLGAPCGGGPAQQERSGRRRGAAAFRGLIGAIARHQGTCGDLQEAFEHFRKVTRSYWPGLFRCYEVEVLPRTNNDLEQFFGSYRYHERRARGRKVARPGTVVRGSVRLTAAAATRLRSIEVADLVPSDLQAWRELRGALEQRQAMRTLGRRFRRDPVAYLRSLEKALIKQALPT